MSVHAVEISRQQHVDLVAVEHQQHPHMAISGQFRMSTVSGIEQV